MAPVGFVSMRSGEIQPIAVGAVAIGGDGARTAISAGLAAASVPTISRRESRLAPKPVATPRLGSTTFEATASDGEEAPGAVAPTPIGAFVRTKSSRRATLAAKWFATTSMKEIASAAAEIVATRPARQSDALPRVAGATDRATERSCSDRGRRSTSLLNLGERLSESIYLPRNRSIIDLITKSIHSLD